jgi:hypothetical protein
LQRICRLSEAAQFDDAGEYPQGHQSIHCPHSRTVIPGLADLSLSGGQLYCRHLINESFKGVMQ